MFSSQSSVVLGQRFWLNGFSYYVSFFFFLTSTSFFIRCTLLHGQRFLLCVSAISRLAAWTDYMSLNMEVVSGSSCCKCVILISSVMFWKAAVNPRWILKNYPGIWRKDLRLHSRLVKYLDRYETRTREYNSRGGGGGGMTRSILLMHVVCLLSGYVK
jgi:hypothetical protein